MTMSTEQKLDNIYRLVTNLTPRTEDEERILGEIYSIIQEPEA